MDQAVSNFLSKEQVGVLSVTLEDGTIHGATVHYSHTSDPFKIYIQTSKASLKASPFLNGEVGKGAMVIGVSEKDWLTLQVHGSVRAVVDEELENVYKIVYQKHPEAEEHKGPKTIFLEFTPTWWKYTDFNTEPPTVINS